MTDIICGMIVDIKSGKATQTGTVGYISADEIKHAVYNPGKNITAITFKGSGGIDSTAYMEGDVVGEHFRRKQEQMKRGVHCGRKDENRLV